MYNHNKIEKKWQDYWYNNNVFKTTESHDCKKNIYILDMFPYPSGAGLHVGHIEGYTASDTYSRFKKLQNFNILHPIGWDAFGLPAEQYAISTGNDPRDFSLKNISNFKRQLKNMGFSYDFDKEINTTDPKYYKWTQWIFIQLYKKGLAEYKEVNVNWCEKLGTVLANEEVLHDENNNDISERGSYPVIQKPMKQWVLKITKYAKQLIEGLDSLDWPDSVINLQKNWIGLEKTKDGWKTKLRDWVFSRQRFWGEPFPIAFSDDGEIYLINKLPVELPKESGKISPSNDGTSPLSNFKEWLNVIVDGKKLTRETNTMPQWAGSSWYYLAFILRENDDYIPLDSQKAYDKFKKWLPVDLYIGGQEHAVLHLIYARFWHQVLYDLNIVPTKEPFLKLLNQGMILGADGKKMSKSKKNGVSPDDIISKYGADALRMYELFIGSIWDDKPWSNNGIIAIRKWQEKIYRLFNEIINNRIKIIKVEKENICILNKTIKEVTKNLNLLKFNISISKLMIFINEIYKSKTIAKTTLIKFLILLTPFAPHIANELLDKHFNTNDQKELWPKYDEKLIKDDKIIISIQISGKLRGLLEIYKGEDSDKKILINRAKNINNVKKILINAEIKKIIYIENKIINFVI